MGGPIPGIRESRGAEPEIDRLGRRQDCEGMTSFRDSDAALLEAFVSGGREDAFAELVRRHGGLVHGVCLRRLRRAEDAEDASQAVFLILARKAVALRGRSSIAGWLHRAAVNVSCNARKAVERRERKEREAASMIAANDPTREERETGWEQVAPVLDAELDRLPEHQRTALILHHIEGLTKEEVARHLGWKPGTVSSRLDRALRRLRTRLAKFGMVISADALVALLAGKAAASPLPPAAAGAAVKTGMLVAGGKTSLGAAATTGPAGALAEGTLKSMATAQLVKVSAAALAVGLTAIAAWVTVRETRERAGPRPPVVAAAGGASVEPPAAAVRRGDEPLGATEVPSRDPGGAGEREEPVSFPGRAGPGTSGQPAPAGASLPRGGGTSGAPTASATGALSVEGVASLYSWRRYKDFDLATCNFGHVILESSDAADRDLLYGKEAGDVLTTALRDDDRGRILDLGERTWEPSFDASTLPARDAPGGAPSARAILGHMYLAHIRDGDTDCRVLFRVEDLVPEERCTLAWAVVDSRQVPGAARRPDPARETGRPPARPAREQQVAPPSVLLPPVDEPSSAVKPFLVREGTATLLARQQHRDFEKATYSFRFGLRDDPDRKITHNDWDLEFGNDGAKGRDQFTVNMHGGDRSRIVDLGELAWGEAEIAGLPTLPVDLTDRQQERRFDNVRVVVGHSYLVRSVRVRRGKELPDGRVAWRAQHDFYALFRVESHAPDDRCTIRWRLVDAPGAGAPPASPGER
jgi:RNA polymerase sigma factor (sigma-70 family)